MGSNRRDGYRVRCDCKADIRFTTIPGSKGKSKSRLECTTTDLSGHGVRVSAVSDYLVPARETAHPSKQAVPDGSKAKIIITFSSPRKKFVHLGTLRWAKKEPGSPVLVMGFEFTDSSKRVLKKWQSFLEEKIAGPTDLDDDIREKPPGTVNIFLDRHPGMR